MRHHESQSRLHEAILNRLKLNRRVAEEDLSTFGTPLDKQKYPVTQRVMRIVYTGKCK